MTDKRRDLDKAASPTPRPVRGAGAASTGSVGVEARRCIGRDLRRLYGSILEQPLPERFTRLIEDLAAGSSNREGSE